MRVILGGGRYEFIDLAKGICILLVVYFHTCSAGPEPISVMLNSFRMPLYFVLSGIFFSRYNGIVDFIIRKTNKLLIPFIFWWLFSFVLISLMSSIAGYGISWDYLSHILFEDVRCNNPIWFLLSLYFCGIIFYLITIISEKYNHHLLLLVLLSSIVGGFGFFFGKFGVNLPFWIDSSMTALPFYAFGFCLRKETDFLQTTDKSKYYIPLSLMLFMITIFSKHVVWKTNDMSDASFFPFYLCGISGTLAILLLSKRINRIPLISFIGRYSICVLVTHDLINNIFFYPFLDELCALTGLADNTIKFLYYIILIISYLLIIPIMIRFFPHVSAQKDIIPHKNLSSPKQLL